MSSSEIPHSPKHHFDSARFTVVRLEETGEVALLYADLVSTYRPVNSQERFALKRMAICQQAMLRAARLESGLFTSCMNESFGPEGAPSLPFRQEMAEGIEITRQINRNFILADGFQLLARQGNSIPLFLRYQVQAERLYRRAVEEFERLKRLRPELQFEANPDDGPPPAESPKPQSDEPLPVLDQSRSNGHQAKSRPPSARCGGRLQRKTRPISRNLWLSVRSPQRAAPRHRQSASGSRDSGFFPPSCGRSSLWL